MRLPDRSPFPHAAALLAVCALAWGPLPTRAQEYGVRRVIDFGSAATGSWVGVNDGVMGGRSSSTLRLSGDGTALFQGRLSLENNGGFASVRTPVPSGSFAGASHVVLRVRGDGHRYQVRLRTTSAWDGVAFGAGFTTIDGEWTTVTLPMEEFEPTYRGYRPRRAPPLDPGDVRQLGIMLADEQEGTFALEIAWIGSG